MSDTATMGTAHAGGPVAPSARYEALDILRGVAVLGILAINIWFMGLPEAFYLNQTVLGPLEGSDKLIQQLIYVLIALKFITLFSLMFGAGIALMAERSGRGRHNRRMLWLLLFGLIHAYLIWPGDILVTYAICGFIVGFLINWRTRSLIILSVVLVVIGGLFGLAFIMSLQFAPPETTAEVIADIWTPGAEALRAETELRRNGSYPEIVAWNFETAIFIQTSAFLTQYGWRTIGIMALGIVLFRTGILTGGRSAVFYIGLALGGLAVGLPIVLQSLAIKQETGYEFFASMGWAEFLNYFGSILVAFGWIGVVIALSKLPILGFVGRAFAATGRMAFTNYITQSVIVVTLMSSWGLGLFGTLSVTELFLLTLGVWALQLIWSPLWLSRFRQGPLEALWRFLTYGRTA